MKLIVLITVKDGNTQPSIGRKARNHTHTCWAVVSLEAKAKTTVTRQALNEQTLFAIRLPSRQFLLSPFNWCELKSATSRSVLHQLDSLKMRWWWRIKSVVVVPPPPFWMLSIDLNGYRQHAAFRMIIVQSKEVQVTIDTTHALSRFTKTTKHRVMSKMYLSTLWPRPYLH